MVVEISGGEFATRDESNSLVETKDVRHVVLWDEGNRNHKNYEITSWPSAYLIGADGKVIWQGNPARMQTRQTEVEAFRKLLATQLKAVDKK